MILLALRDYLRQRGHANLRDMVQHFAAEPDAVRAMLAHLIHKGQVSKDATTSHCGGCTQCDPMLLEVYYWGARWSTRH